MSEAPSPDPSTPGLPRPSPQAPPRGRYAPSPTGLLHVGNARTALAAWLSVRSRGGSFVWRLEDLDPPRVVAGAAEAALADLAWLGLDWDEGPDVGGPFAPYAQSERGGAYEAALRVLHDGGHLFPCTLSRRELASMASAPHGADDEAPYPVSARPADLADNWYDEVAARGGAALRFRSDHAVIAFTDFVQGKVEQASGGDFVLRRRDGLYAYQLAVTVDDHLMGVDEVVRGSDLLGSTARQVELLEALGGRRPAYAHVPMVLNGRGEKLSKRDDALTLRALRERGIRAPQLVGSMAFSLGLLDRPAAVTAADLVEAFDWARVGARDWTLPDDFADRVAALR